jgi:hypothetical protein
MQNSADSSGRQAGGAYPHPVIAWYAIFIFYLAYTLAFVDRIIISFLVTPIRADFQITDFQFSLSPGSPSPSSMQPLASPSPGSPIPATAATSSQWGSASGV